MLSGTCYANTAAVAKNAGNVVAQTVHCDTASDVAACLRAANAADLTLAPVQFSTGVGGEYNAPNVDGYVLPADPANVVQQGHHNHVPVIESSTQDEYTTLSPPQITTTAQLRAKIQQYYAAGQTDAILNLYSAYPNPENALVAVLSDDNYICPTRTQTRAFAAAQTEPVRRAFFTHTFESGPFRSLRAGHGMDLFFGFHVFGTVPASAAEITFADAMGGYWTRFAATGDPNGDGAVAWPVYDATMDDALQLDETIAVKAPVRKQFCDYWDWYWGG
jgi:para-nitrobenzyl esterase